MIEVKEGDRVILDRYPFDKNGDKRKGIIIKRPNGLLMKIDNEQTWYNVVNNREYITLDIQWYREQRLKGLLDV